MFVLLLSDINLGEEKLTQRKGYRTLPIMPTIVIQPTEQVMKDAEKFIMSLIARHFLKGGFEFSLDVNVIFLH